MEKGEVIMENVSQLFLTINNITVKRLTMKIKDAYTLKIKNTSLQCYSYTRHIITINNERTNMKARYGESFYLCGSDIQ